MIESHIVLLNDMKLSPEQLLALRSVPLGAMPNKVRLARTMLRLTQAEVAEETGIKAPALSDIERGGYKDVPLENTRVLSRFYGAEIEDLFPAREAVAS